MPPLSDDRARLLTADAAAALAAAFGEHWTLHGERDGALQDAVRRVAARARLAGLPIERVLVALKQAWFERYAEAPTEPTANRERLSALVSTCIDAYYRSSR